MRSDKNAKITKELTTHRIHMTKLHICDPVQQIQASQSRNDVLGSETVRTVHVRTSAEISGNPETPNGTTNLPPSWK
jgi:hypothetical protein